MALGIGPKNSGAANNVVNSDLNSAGPGGVGGYLNEQKDAKTKSTDPQFGEIMKQFQAKFGAKPEKAREIKKTLGKDDFLKIMITQMKNQDPTKPFNADQMAAQMAQYASVEQLQNVNQNIQKLQSDNKTSERMAMTGMIGKIVTVDRERFPHTEGQNESLVYSLPQDAKEVKLTIMSETGEPILEKDLGSQKKGDQSFSWDGAKDNTIQTKTGGYIFKIAAKDKQGNPMQINAKSKGKVIGVGFDGAEPFLLVGNAQHSQKITMKNVSEIDEAPQPVLMPYGNPIGLQSAQSAGQGAGGGEAQAPGGGKFFTFKRGEGSQNLDSSELPPDAQAALQRYQAANAANTAATGSTAGAVADSAAARNPALLQQQAEGGVGQKSKGFPSGLTDSGNN